MKFVDRAICDVCGKEIKMPNARIEWNYAPGKMRLVHHECSFGWSNKAVNPLSDMIFDQPIYCDPDFVYKRLQELKTDEPELSTIIDQMLYRLFDNK